MVKKLSTTFAIAFAVVAMAISTSYAALSADATAIFTAVDTAGMSTAISGLLVAFIGITLVFFAYKIAKRAIHRG